MNVMSDKAMELLKTVLSPNQWALIAQVWTKSSFQGELLEDALEVKKLLQEVLTSLQEDAKKAQQ